MTFVFVKTWRLIACDTDIYAIILILKLTIIQILYRVTSKLLEREFIAGNVWNKVGIWQLISVVFGLKLNYI